jgi:hypothetical protein
MCQVIWVPAGSAHDAVVRKGKVAWVKITVRKHQTTAHDTM